MYYLTTNAEQHHDREQALARAQERIDQGQDVRLIDGAEVKLVVDGGRVSKVRGTE